ncbi:MAG: DUF11 domain-containing protein [Chloroflexaceae bacterium]|nr:DUF11 domain-containing protein [Chloroflexaceae bacterium]
MLEGDEVVEVGEVLEFTIRIRNTGSLSITQLVVVDTFEASIVAPSGIGQYAEADDPPLAIPAADFDGNNTITWDNAVSELPNGELGPGETLELTVHLRPIGQPRICGL